MGRPRTIIASIVAILVVIGVSTTASPVHAQARPVPKGLAAADRSCDVVVPSWTLANTALASITSCVVTTGPGTLLMTASGSVGITGSAVGNGSETPAFFRISEDGSPLQESYTSVDPSMVNPELRPDGSDRAFYSQSTITVGAGSHTVQLFGGRDTRTDVSPNTPVATDIDLRALFIPAGSTEQVCSGIGANQTDVDPSASTQLASCPMTTTVPGKVYLTGAARTFNLGGPITHQIGLTLTVDSNARQPFSASRAADNDFIYNGSQMEQNVVDLSPGAHVFTLSVHAVDLVASTTVYLPSLRVVFVPNTSPTAAIAVTSTFATPTSTSRAFANVLDISVPTAPRRATLTLTLMGQVQIAGTGATQEGIEEELELIVDGQPQPMSTRAFDTDSSTNGVFRRFPFVVTATVALTAGAHTAQLALRRTGGGFPADAADVTAVAHMVVDDADVAQPTPAPTPDPTPTQVDYVPVVPDRVLDTRDGLTPAAGQTVEVDVTGRGTSQVPDNATAVVLNVTGTNAGGAGYVTVWPCGSPQPTASNLNLRPGVTSPNLVISKIGTDGKVCLFTQSVADLVADVNGYMPAGSTYVPLVPERLLDTRASGQIGYTGSKPAAGSTVVLQVTGVGSSQLPANTESAVLNITGTGADADGYVTVWPCGSPRPNASNLNIAAGVTTPNLVVAEIGDGGQVCIYTQSSMDLIADVNGSMPLTSFYTPLLPERLLETRPDGQTGYSGGKPGAGSTIELTVTGVGSSQVPAGSTAVVLNITGVEPDAAGFVTVWPCGADRPTASNLNLTPGVISPNLVMSKIGDGGKVCIYTQGPAHLVADINGYWP
ncbi:MAG: hypothetical protein JWM34_4149 [Ilumatobacteraceae bacterium]|nr:hypothetical protein [Ilumatobacteraceae bacterium]